ncbi:hypothetical protein SKAU_G00264230 [Synaphobranchus kaupii]|uniref:Arf-GAP with Rho-GAP domain, ANK repeat and PH domain-containing protein 1 n=1 Tax=Synaphobranchus kaupii TaxID=118154 RepID=A0A9Q1IPZ8_SYNKA|nr:hypothetical protein SKAU_G00264230 [Synaphobranchus kaupii]
MAGKGESQAAQKLEELHFGSMSSEYDDIDNKDHNSRISRPSISDSISLYSNGSLASHEADPDPQTSPVIKMGWLEKTPPQGSLIFQRRWVRLDADYLRYFKNDKVKYSKKIIPIASITNAVRVSDQRLQVVTQNRTFLFRAQSESERDMWMSALQEAMGDQHCCGDMTPSICMQGHLEMQGQSKFYVVVCTSTVFLYRNAEEFKAGIGITSIEMNVGTVKDADHRAFDLITPFKTFRFVAESDQAKEEWLVAMQSSIEESFSNHEVAKRIWSEGSNRFCADCGEALPKWASINLCVVVCEQCAGMHRRLGSNISKVRSLEMDKKVWTDALIQLFLLLGNERANLFWAGNVPPGNLLSPFSSSEQRGSFISAKYQEGRYRCHHKLFGHQEKLNNALCINVQTDDVLETLCLVFCGADIHCDTHSSASPTPTSLAKSYNQTLQAEFLRQNQSTFISSPEVRHDVSKTPSVALLSITQKGYLFKTGSVTRSITTRKGKEEFSQRWCSLNEDSFRYYENEKNSNLKGELKMKGIACLAVNPPDTHGYAHTFEICTTSGRLYLFGADDPDTLREWIKSIAKAIVPPSAGDIVDLDFERIGKLRCRDRLNLLNPQMGFFALVGTILHACFENGERADIDLRKLQELSIQQEHAVLILVGKHRTLHFEIEQKLQFQGWCAAIKQSAQSTGKALSQQQLTHLDIPVIVDCCVTYITKYGLNLEGIYRKSGVNSSITALLEAFRQDARRVWLQEGKHKVEDVSGVLKRFFRDLEDSVFTSPASAHWLGAIAVREESKRVLRYQSLFCSLPPVNKATLRALINHLYCVQHFANINQMSQCNLAIVFGPTLFQTDGIDSSASQVIEDLIQHYVAIFNADEQHLQRQLNEIKLINKLREDGVTEIKSPHIFCTVYLEEKEERDEHHVKISVTMTAAELILGILDQCKISQNEQESWSCFEVNERAETERLLHYQEKVLPVFHSPGRESILLVKRNVFMKAMLHYLAGKVNIRKSGVMKFREERTVLGRRGGFLSRFFVLLDTSLKLFKEVQDVTSQSIRPEREWPVKSLRVYRGIKARLRPPTSWGMTIVYEDERLENQRWCMCCETQTDMIEWMATFLSVQHEGNVWPVE